MKIRACEVVQEDIEDVRADDGEILSGAEDDIVKRSQSSSSQISQMTILMDEDQIVSDNDETEKKFEETFQETVEENVEAKDEANIENAGEGKSSDTEKHAENEVLDVNRETENDIDADCDPEVNNEVIEENSESENRNDLNAQSSSSQISQMKIILDEDQVVSDNDETEEKIEETAEANAEAKDEANIENANIENASEDKFSDTEKHDENAETEIGIDEDCDSEVNNEVVKQSSESENRNDFIAAKAVREALDNDETNSTSENDSEEDEEVHEETAEALVDDEDDIDERVNEDDADFRQNNDEDKSQSELSNGETKTASTIEDSGRDSFPPTENSSSYQQEEAEEEATMYDFDEDCEEFEKQRIVSIFFPKLSSSISGLNLMKTDPSLNDCGASFY